MSGDPLGSALGALLWPDRFETPNIAGFGLTVAGQQLWTNNTSQHPVECAAEAYTKMCDAERAERYKEEIKKYGYKPMRRKVLLLCAA